MMQVGPRRWADVLAEPFAAAKTLGYEMAVRDEMQPPDEWLWGNAHGSLRHYAQSGPMPVPLVMPLQLGGVSVEWHEQGLDVELRFRTRDRVWIEVADRRGEVAPVSGTFADFSPSAPALLELIARNAPGQ